MDFWERAGNSLPIVPSLSPSAVQLGAAIRRQREAKGLTIERLAIDARMDFSHLSRVEAGKRSIGFKKLAALNDTLGRMRLSELIALAETLDPEP
jgi:transcriptional regulator with XRE-family HTH domain